ncbi:MAG: MerC domain-containing protein [Kofleriaceae bacterium]|nr:MerC domain-containing protein [Kofleriaceae bacterium]
MDSAPSSSPARVEGPTVDRVGIVASLICAVHCFAGAILASASSLGLLFADERIELTLAGIAAVVAAIALALGARAHRRIAPLLVGAAGLTGLVLARTPVGEQLGEAYVSVAGSVLLIVGHVLNLRAYRQPVAHLHAYVDN